MAEADSVAKRKMCNKEHDLMILKKFGVQCHPRKAPRAIKVRWYPPLRGWGIFRDHRGDVCGVFVQKLGIRSAFFAKFVALILAVEAAKRKGWNKVWFEINSELTLRTFYNKSYSLPWVTCRRWEACMAVLDGMKFRCSYI